MADTAPETEQFVKPRHFELRLKLLFASIFVSVGFHLPYFPLWLERNGFDPNQIALVLSIPLFLRLATTPVITALADRLSERVHMLILMTGLTFLLSLGFLLPPAYWFILLLSVVLQVVWTPHAPLADSLALSGVRRFGTDYPGVRKWGSASFLAANLFGGMIVGHWGANAVPYIIVAGLALTLAASIGAPRLGRPRRASPLSSAGLLKSPQLMTRPFIVVVAAAGVINSSHGLLFSFGSIYWRDVGIGETMIGVLWAFMVLCEIALMMVFRRFFGSSSAPRLLALGGAAAALRWLMMPAIEAFGIGLPGYFLAQSLHAFSTGLLLLGVPKMVAETIGEERMGAAQGAVFLANGLSMALVMLVCGAIYANLGVSGFYLMAAIAVAGTALLLLVSPKAPAQGERPANPDS